jgi:hypothetical protein
MRTGIWLHRIATSRASEKPKASHRFKNELAMLDAMLRLQERDTILPASAGSAVREPSSWPTMDRVVSAHIREPSLPPLVSLWEWAA